MKPNRQTDLIGLSMLDLFRAEAENQTAVLVSGLLELERTPDQTHSFEALMRAAHSLKGAARIVGLQAAETVAHALEDNFVAAQAHEILLTGPTMDLLLRGVDLLANLAKRAEADIPRWDIDHSADIHAFLEASSALRPKPANSGAFEDQSKHSPTTPQPRSYPPANAAVPQPLTTEPPLHPPADLVADPAPASLARIGASYPLPQRPQSPAPRKAELPERVVRLTAENLNRLLALAGESLVESRWLRSFADSLQHLKRDQRGITQTLERLRHSLEHHTLSEHSRGCFNELFREVADSERFLVERIKELDVFDRRSAHLSQRLYLEVLRTRMRPFSDGTRRFPRMVRDLARALGKQIKFEMLGEHTPVDRDILERLETPIAHLLRNAVDHGCEPPSVRKQSGKPPECSLRLEARHSAGVLLVTVSDDGSGVNLELIRRAIVARRFTSDSAAAKLSEADLLEFLFMPGFSLKETVTEISGRGFGLDVVQNMVKSLRGAIRLSNYAGQGFRVQLQLPLTLSVLRALLVDVGGEPYAIPLGQITRTLKLPRTKVASVEGREQFQFDGQQVGLLAAHQLLDCPAPLPSGANLPVVILSGRSARHGLVVDGFLGERELVVQPLDPRLGRVRDIAAAALMEDGSPVLIIDTEEMLRSMERLIGQPALNSLQSTPLATAGAPARLAP
ncbi:MAG TPA: chemotaxis protein CheA [Verrucomicrobiae bacterium]|nr:chemotaxis protein CheA [Verrucomicrobiae bacterium]